MTIMKERQLNNVDSGYIAAVIRIANIYSDSTIMIYANLHVDNLLTTYNIANANTIFIMLILLIRKYYMLH